VVGERHSPEPTGTDRRADGAAWVRENLPGWAAVAAGFKAAFGELRLTWASEGGHVIGKLGPDGVKLSETVVGRMALAKKMEKSR